MEDEARGDDEVDIGATLDGSAVCERPARPVLLMAREDDADPGELEMMGRCSTRCC